MTASGSRTFSGQVRAAKAQELGLDNAIEAAVNSQLNGTGISVSVGLDASKLTVTPTGDKLELRFKSMLQATAGGGRISLDAPLAKVSFSTLEAAVEQSRRLEITVDYDNPAFQEMAIASSPTRFDGKTSDVITLTLIVNDTPVDVTLAAQAGNTNLDQLVGQLQTAVNSALGVAGFAAGDVIVKRASLNPDDPNSLKGNRILFEGKSGTVTSLAMEVPDSPTNGAITELGYQAGLSDTKRSKASGFFLEDVSFGGNIGLFEDEVSATAALGLLAITAEMDATLDASTGKFFGADVDFDLVNPLNGSSRVDLDLLANALNDKKFLFQADDMGGTLADPGTGFIDGVVAGGLGLDLTLEPDGIIAGLPTDLGSIEIWAQSPNWLLQPPSLSNPFELSKDDQDLGTSTIQLGINPVLSQDLLFVLSQEVGGDTYETPVIVRAIDTVGNANLAALQADIQAALNAAEARLQHMVDKAGGSETVASATAAVSGAGALTFVGSLNDATDLNLRGLFVDIQFNKPSGLDDLLDSLKDLSFDDILTVLKLVVDMLQGLDGSDDGSPLADVFDFKIPVIERSIGDLVDLSGDFLDFVDELVANPASSLQLLETRLRAMLGLPAISVQYPSILSFNTTAKTLYFDLGFESSTSTTRPFSLDLADANLGVFSQLVGLSASGNLGVEAAIDLDLSLGLDLDGSDKSFFLDVANSGLSATASAFGNNLAFEAALGPVGVFVQGGEASLDGSFTVDFANTGVGSDGRLVLLGFDAAA